MPCPNCGATNGTVFDADGTVLSCESCDETKERTSVKVLIDSETLRKLKWESQEARRKQVKDVIDLGLKAAGVAVGAGVLLKKTEPPREVDRFHTEPPPLQEGHPIKAALWRAGLRIVEFLSRSVRSEYWVLALRNGHLIEMGQVPENASKQTYYECLSNLGLSHDEFALLITRQAYQEDAVFLLCIVSLLDKNKDSDGPGAFARLRIYDEIRSRFPKGTGREWNHDEYKALLARRELIAFAVREGHYDKDLILLLREVLPEKP